MQTRPPGTPSDALLARYLADDCSATERREVELWLDASPVNRAHLDELRTLWSPPVAKPHWDVEEMWSGVRRAMADDALRNATPREPGARVKIARRVPTFVRPRQAAGAGTLFRRSSLAAAAMVAVAIGISVLVLQRRDAGSVVQAERPMREYATTRGQSATIQLTDGTRLVLAAESRIRIPHDFGLGAREVFLEGQAVFDVVHYTARPFRVLARDAVAEDIGTRFDVQAYPEDSTVTVAVVEGIVALGRRRSPESAAAPSSSEVAEGVVLHRSDVGTLGPDGRVSSVRDPDVERRVAWASGRLEFVDAPLREVLRVIGRWYDVDLRVQGAALSSRGVTASFEVQSVDQMIHALALAVDARVERKGKEVILRARL
jgi:ferric-dicitrate binding protein FerR (iron transport regulator)